jgi:hypothetical protein
MRCPNLGPQMPLRPATIERNRVDRIQMFPVNFDSLFSREAVVKE